MQSRQGDQTAYKKLLIQIAPVVRRTVAARLRGWEQHNYTEDITQETLLAVHLKLHTYDAKLDFLPWLRTVARYKMIDFQRRTRYAQTESIDNENVPELQDAANQQDRTASRDLDKLLSLLKPPTGAIIHALKVEGTSVRELAATYKVSEGSIKVLVHRGLQKLSQLVRTERMAAP